jgi:hypothetical protein
MLILGVNLLLLALLLWGLHRNHNSWPGVPLGYAGSTDTADRDLERVLSELRARF